MYTLPTSITVSGKQFTITENGDFRMVLDCFSALNDEELSEDLRVLASLLIFYNEFNTIEDIRENEDLSEDLVKEMYRFMNCNQENSPGAQTSRSLIDWDKDSQMICAAVNNVAKAEIRAIPYLHWWTFLGYYMSVGESVMSTVVSIRDKIVHNKKLEKWERDFKRDNPTYFQWKSSTLMDREAEAVIRELWNSGGEK